MHHDNEKFIFSISKQHLPMSMSLLLPWHYTENAVSKHYRKDESLFQISIIFLSFAFLIFVMLTISHALHPLLRDKFFVPFVF